MQYIRNIWYVAAWAHELDHPIGRIVIEDPIVLWRTGGGSVVAMEDRCPHRYAPLSLGRVEGESIRCMYHGMRYGAAGACIQVPGTDKIPPNSDVRVYPAVERDSWIWVWMGDPLLADPGTIPEVYGLNNPLWAMQDDVLDYEADYRLINDNLTDLSHLDFVHETTLGAATGSRWSDELPKVERIENGLIFERWFLDHPGAPGRPEKVDTRNVYRYLLPGIFIMRTSVYPSGTFNTLKTRPLDQRTPLLERVEQQAVSPISERRTRYFFATGVNSASASPAILNGMAAIVKAAFAEDRQIIEAQQRVLLTTPEGRRRAYIPQDRAPEMFRQLLARRIADEWDKPSKDPM